MLKSPAITLSGKINVVDIGLPNDLESFNAVTDQVMNAETVLEMLPERPPDAHKGTFGTALIVAGLFMIRVAAMLAGEGAYRVGTGSASLLVFHLCCTRHSRHHSQKPPGCCCHMKWG